MAIEAASIAEIIYRYVVNNQICMTVLHYTYAQGATTADGPTATIGLLNKVKDPLTNQLAIRLASMQAANVAYLDVSAQIVWPTRFLKFSSAFALSGTDAGNCTAQNVAAVVTKQSQFAGRFAVGSVHIGGLSTGAYSGGLVTGPFKTKMTFFGTEMLNSINDVGNGILWSPSIMNKTPIVGTDPPKYKISGSTYLFTFVAQPELRVLRRRTVGLGI